MLYPVAEHIKYNQNLHQTTLFPQVNISNQAKVSCIVLSCRFRSIEFNKKRALPFFLAIELLTHRKCVASLSHRNIQAWKIRKGRLVGCKVTLRREGLIDFINTLTFTFPRMEKNKAFIGFFSSFYAKYINSLKFKTKIIRYPNYIRSLDELILFYPIELGLGLHADVRQVIVNFKFSTISIEERYFLLQQVKVPIVI